MKRVGLYFGSFNPIHFGHIQIARYILNQQQFDSIWFVPSPQNPHKDRSILIPSKIRLQWVKQAISEEKNMQCCDIEFKLPQPNFTIDTVTKLKSEYPDIQFELIIGADNLENFHLWKDAEKLAIITPLNVYPRTDFPIQESLKKFNPKILNAPLHEVSATRIREAFMNPNSESEKWIQEWVPSTIIESVRSFFQSVKPEFN